jgi:hypothetical protein
MKKVLAIFAITALVACGGATTTEVVTDSTAVQTDSTAVVSDSTATTPEVGATTEATVPVK